MKTTVLNQKGEKVKEIDLSKSFDAEISDQAIALYINYLRNAIRDAVANSKDRSEVSGGGKKPYKQKGTGRARQGSSRSPLWVGGGVTFGPTNERNFKISINKKMKKRVILGLVASMFKDKKTVLVDSLVMTEPKTKNAVETLNNLKAEGKISFVYSTTDTGAKRSFGNIAGINMMTASKLDIINFMTSSNVIMSVSALEEIENLYSNS